MKLAIDFGTTNSVIAQWGEGEIEVLALPGLSAPGTPLIPSLVYVEDGHTAQTIAGQTVCERGLDRRPDNRLFRNFKRGIVASPAPAPRPVDGVLWGDQDAGQAFLRHVLKTLPVSAAEIEQLVLTAPVAAFEDYLAWLSGTMEQIAPDLPLVRLVDEATAAALGYAVTEPGAIVLVFDFGGGTLGLSLVQLPEHKEQTGGFLGRLRNPRKQAARVIAKAGRVLGGSDIDQWLLADVLRRTGLTREALGGDYAALLTRCEQAKIALSTAERVTLEFTAGGQAHRVPLTRADLETLLEDNLFFTALRHVVDKVMHTARQEGVFREDIHAVLLVGGVSLMPSVQMTLQNYFGETAIRAHKPFTAVVEGALLIAAGYGLDDYLVHSYGLRYLSEETNTHAYDELIPMGTRCPSEKPFEVLLSTAHPGQREIEFVIGEISTEAVSLVEVTYEDGQAVFVAKTGENTQRIIPLNADMPTVAPVTPGQTPGEGRLRALFMVDDQRQLRLTVTDAKRRKKLLNDIPVVTLR
jgi:molecular chaperone DnaK (HSP70)